MRIAFVSGNRETLPDPVIPFGLLYLMASTPDHHQKELLDLCFEREPEEAIGKKISVFGPDLIALSIRNIQRNDYTGTRDTIEYYAGLIRAIRDATTAPIVIGGSGFSVTPRKMMMRLRPEFGIAGEGERSFPDLLAALEHRGHAFDRIHSLHWFQAGELISNPPPREPIDMDTLPFPDRSLVDSRYYERCGIESIQTKRGCPLLCDYCTYPLIEGRVSRVRDPVAVVNEMFRVLELQPTTRHFYIVDSVFNLPKRHAKSVCTELIRRNWRVPWTCYANPLGFDREFADLARDAGCSGMEIGSDSGCDEILAQLKKGFTTEQIRSIHKLCYESGIPDCHTFILGTRGETLEHVRRTLDFIVDLDPFSAIIMIWTDDEEALDHGHDKTRAELRAQIEGMLTDLKNEFPYWTIPELGIKFGARLFQRLRRAGLHGPLWQHLRGPQGHSR